MKMKSFSLFAMCLLMFSCQKEVTPLGGASDARTTLERPGTGFSARRVGGDECAVAQLVNMVRFDDDQVAGTMSVINDEEFLHITVSANEAEVYVNDIQVLYGTEEFVTNPDAYTLDGAFVNPQIRSNTTETTSTLTVSIPLSSFDEDCFSMNVHAGFYTIDANGNKTMVAVKSKPSFEAGRLPGEVSPGIIQYCLQRCVEPTCGQLRTQTPGGWGASPSGNNPASYLYANFAGAFPSGLVIGCTPDYRITLTSAEAVTKFLPAGGKAVKLTTNYTNPTGFKNVLAGHLTALTLSVGFDNYDERFGEAGITLGDMVIPSGVFAGFTVSQFLEIANNTLGGCSTNFTIQQVLETATSINENYVDGKSDNGFLVCPQ